MFRAHTEIKESKYVANFYYNVVFYVIIDNYKFRSMSKHCHFNSLNKQKVNFQTLQIIKEKLIISIEPKI